MVGWNSGIWRACARRNQTRDALNLRQAKRQIECVQLTLKILLGPLQERRHIDFRFASTLKSLTPWSVGDAVELTDDLPISNDLPRLADLPDTYVSNPALRSQLRSKSDCIENVERASNENE